jgi:hypothetical protein
MSRVISTISCRTECLDQERFRDGTVQGSVCLPLFCIASANVLTASSSMSIHTTLACIHTQALAPPHQPRVEQCSCV